MTLLICGIISLSLFVASILLAIKLRKDLRKSVRVLSAGFFMLIFVAIAPCHVNDGGYSFGVNLFDTICVMITQSSLTGSLEVISQYQSRLVGAYKIYLICLYVLGPLSIASATLSFVKGFGKVVYILKAINNESYIFSSVNERSLAVCKSIRHKHPRAVILFALDCGVYEVDENIVSQIDELGGIIVNQDVKKVKHSLSHKRHYCLLNEDASVNIEQGLAINCKYKDNKSASRRVELLIYSTDEMSQIVFYNTKHYVTIQLFREEDIIANDLLFNYPLYGGVAGNELNILIVGCGKIGYEILKKTIWTGYLGKQVRTQINVVDLNADIIESRLKKECPALYSECKLNVSFYNADTANDSFTKALEKMCIPTYIVVALGSEEANVEACIYLRRYFGLTNGFPKMHMTTNTESYARNLDLLAVYDWTVDKDRSFCQRSETEQNFDIKGFGSYESAYENIYPDDSDFGKLALACHIAKLNLPLNKNGSYRKQNETIRQFINSLSYSYNQISFCKNNADQLALSISDILYALDYPTMQNAYLEQVREKLKLQTIYDIPFVLYIDSDYDFKNELQKNIDKILDLVTERYNRFMYTLGWTNLPVDEIKNKSTRDQLRLRYARIGKYDVNALEELINNGEKDKKDYRQNDIDEILRLPLVLKVYDEIALGEQIE